MNPTTPLPPEYGWVEIEILGGERIEEAARRAALIHVHNPDVGVKFLFNGVIVRQPAHRRRPRSYEEAVEVYRDVILGQYNREVQRRMQNKGEK